MIEGRRRPIDDDAIERRKRKEAQPTPDGSRFDERAWWPPTVVVIVIHMRTSPGSFPDVINGADNNDVCRASRRPRECPRCPESSSIVRRQRESVWPMIGFASRCFQRRCSIDLRRLPLTCFVHRSQLVVHLDSQGLQLVCPRQLDCHPCPQVYWKKKQVEFRSEFGDRWEKRRTKQRPNDLTE